MVGDSKAQTFNGKYEFPKGEGGLRKNIFCGGGVGI